VIKQPPEPPAADATSVIKRLGARPARIPSKVVLGGDREVVIVHGKDEYLLRLSSDDTLTLSR